MPFPAMFSAVPWSGEVRMMFNPAVKFMPSSLAMYLNGIKPHHDTLLVFHQNFYNCLKRKIHQLRMV